MQGILNFLYKENDNLLRESKDIYNKDSYLFLYFNLSMIKVDYKYTNEKSKKRKESTKYFIGDYSTKEINKDFISIFKNWIEDENSKRKYNLLNPKIISISPINGVSFWGDKIGIHLHSFDITKNLSDEFSENSTIKNVLSFFRTIPSNNIKDYVIQCELECNTYIANVTYKTVNGNIKNKRKMFTQITNNKHNGTPLFSSIYPEGMARRSIENKNEKEPYRKIEFIQWEVERNYKTIL